ncbi:MAG: VOC family protein [Hyellaceae cyanobacterium CSU_1_1]|nr:VOC family protein [Hyellaceae cyanobacterium CSU_1_1]
MKSNYFDIFVTLSTDKIQLMVDFYSQLLNQQPTTYQPGIYAEFQLKELKFGIFKPKAERLAEFSNQSSSMSLCLEVDNLAQAIAHISDLGYPPPGEIIEASHGREIYAYDPGNNRLILHQSTRNFG